MTARAMTEKDLQEAIEDLAGKLGWLTYHTRLPWKSAVGFPDLVMVRAGRVVVAELKRAGKEPTEAQRRWLEEFGLNPGVEVYAWTPDDWFAGAIDEVLR